MAGHLRLPGILTLLKHTNREVNSCYADCQQVAVVAPELDLGLDQYVEILYSLNKAEITIVLKPRGDVTINPPKQGYKWLKNVYASAKTNEKYLFQLSTSKILDVAPLFSN